MKCTSAYASSKQRTVKVATPRTWGDNLSVSVPSTGPRRPSRPCTTAGLFHRAFERGERGHGTRSERIRRRIALDATTAISAALSLKCSYARLGAAAVLGQGKL
ncbi:hypothetical protein ACJJTC_007097 [Scirpophaga incertulas]